MADMPIKVHVCTRCWWKKEEVVKEVDGQTPSDLATVQISTEGELIVVPHSPTCWQLGSYIHRSGWIKP